MRIPDRLRSVYSGQEAIVRTGTTVRTGITDWFQIGKGVCQGYILSPCLFNLYAEYIMRDVGLNEAHAGIKISKYIYIYIYIYIYNLSYIITSGTQMTPPLWQKAKN